MVAEFGMKLDVIGDLLDYYRLILLNSISISNLIFVPMGHTSSNVMFLV